MAEALNMVAYHVVGLDLAVGLAVQAGQLELNVMMPLIAFELLEEMDLLAAGVRQFTDRCVKGIVADAERCREYAERSVGLATILKPIIGYAAASEVAKAALRSGKTIRQEVIDRVAGEIAEARRQRPDLVLVLGHGSGLVSWATVIPVVGGLIGLWSIPVAVISVEELYGLTRGKAVAVVLIPVVVLMALACVGVAVLGGSLVAMLMHQGG